MKRPVKLVAAACLFAALAVPSHSAASTGAVTPDLVKVGAAVALIISEAMPFLPIRANGLLHAAVLLMRAIGENVE